MIYKIYIFYSIQLDLDDFVILSKENKDIHVKYNNSSIQRAWGQFIGKL